MVPSIASGRLPRSHRRTPHCRSFDAMEHAFRDQRLPSLRRRAPHRKLRASRRSPQLSPLEPQPAASRSPCIIFDQRRDRCVVRGARLRSVARVLRHGHRPELRASLSCPCPDRPYNDARHPAITSTTYQADAPWPIWPDFSGSWQSAFLTPCHGAQAERIPPLTSSDIRSTTNLGTHIISSAQPVAVQKPSLWPGMSAQ